MKKFIISLTLGLVLSLGMFTACNQKAKEPEVTKMELGKDSLKVTEKQVNNDIEKVQKAMKDLDKEFETKN